MAILSLQLQNVGFKTNSCLSIHNTYFPFIDISHDDSHALCMQ